MIELQLLIASFLGGIFTILAPCIVPVLPIVLGTGAGSKSKIRPLIIVTSLIASIIVFTLAVRSITDLLGLSIRQLQVVAGYIILVFGFLTIFPGIWESISQKLKLNTGSNKLMGKGLQRGDIIGDVIVGASLGPVFTSCSPAYFVIVGFVLSGNLVAGSVYIVLYGLGLGLMLMLVAILGQKLVSRLGWATDPKGKFKIAIGIIFVILGFSIITGLDKEFEAWLLAQGWYEPIANFESSLTDTE